MTSMTSPDRPLGLLVKIFPKLSETFILEEVLGLERSGMALRLYALRQPTDAISHAAVSRVRAPVTVVPQWRPGQRAAILLRHLRLLAGSPRRYAWALGHAIARGRAALEDFAQAGWLAVQLHRDGVAHLHTHFIATPADVAQFVSEMGAVRFSISAHAKDIYLSTPDALRRKLSAARFTVTCTEANRLALARIAPHARVYRMYHGVDRGPFQPRPRRPGAVPLILSVGRLRAKKGLDTLVEACGLLRSRGIHVNCEIIGYGEEEPRLRTRIEECGLADCVRLTGKLAREQVIEAYARAAVYVQPSRIAADGDRDGIPNVLLEAMAMGLPVVASNVSGIPELVIDGENGLLVPPDDAAALADAITRVLHEPTASAALAQRARETVAASFDNDRNLLLLRNLLQEAEHAVPAGARASRPAAHAESLGVK